MITQEKIKEVAERIGREYKPEKIIFFCFYSWGKPTQNNDVDLFIIKDTKNTREMAREIDGSVFPRNFSMDLIVYTPAQFEKEVDLEEPFISKIKKKGKVLFIKIKK